MSFEVQLRPSTGEGNKINIEPADVQDLPIYENIKGVYPFYAPTESGKTVIARAFLTCVFDRNTVDYVLCLTPATRPEWDTLKQECQARGIEFDYVFENQMEYVAVLMDHQKDAFKRNKKTGKVVMIWDDQMGYIDMNQAPWNEMCRTLAASSRHEEVNIVWLVLAQDPTAMLTTVRSNAAVSFFTQCDKRQMAHIMDSLTDIDSELADRLMYNFQFLVFVRKNRQMFVTKVDMQKK